MNKNSRGPKPGKRNEDKKYIKELQQKVTNLELMLCKAQVAVAELEAVKAENHHLFTLINRHRLNWEEGNR